MVRDRVRVGSERHFLRSMSIIKKAVTNFCMELYNFDFIKNANPAISFPFSSFSSYCGWILQ